MNSLIFKNILLAAKKLDNLGRYAEADKLFLKVSQYGPNGTSKNQSVQYFEMDEIDDEYKQNEYNYRTKNPPLRVPEYYDLGGEADGPNMEGILNGPDSVPGPAYIDPGNQASSPSMAGGDLSYFTWEEAYENNPNTRIPRR